MRRIDWREVHAWAWVAISGATFGSAIYFSLGGA